VETGKKGEKNILLFQKIGNVLFEWSIRKVRTIAFTSRRILHEENDQNDWDEWYNRNDPQTPVPRVQRGRYTRSYDES